MTIIKALIDFILHIDVHLGQIISNYGVETYLILFLIIFCETGLVFIPFLPGDSLLFAAGTFAALGNLNTGILLLVVYAAAILGDAVNYSIGKYLGPKLLNNKSQKFIKKEYIERTQNFYDIHGGKTIIIARFIPIIRTFAPFVAGIGDMHYRKFLSYNAIGGIAWASIGVIAGVLFGQIPFVKAHFSTVILGIVFISVLPAAIPYLKSKVVKKAA